MTDRSHHAGAGSGRGRTGPPGSGSGSSSGYPPAADSCSQELRFALGSYALGALDPAEADQVRLHLVECAACRAEYRELAAVPAILARITETEMAANPVPPGSELLNRLLDQAAAREASFRGPESVGIAAEAAAAATARESRLGSSFSASTSSVTGSGFDPARTDPDAHAPTLNTGRPQHTHGRRRAVVRQKSRLLTNLWSGSTFRRISIAAAGGALAAVAVLGVYAATSGSHKPNVFSNQLSAENAAMHISGELQYHATEWGSWVEVTMHNVPPGDDCMLLAVDAKGNRVVASTWWAPSSGTATIPGGVAMQADEIMRFQVVTATGTTLLDMPVRH